MIGPATRLIVVLCVCGLAIGNSVPIAQTAGEVIDAVIQSPANAIALLALCVSGYELVRFLFRLISPSYVARFPMMKEGSAGTAVLAPGRVALNDPIPRASAAGESFDMSRRARHEAAHVVAALELGGVDVAADIVARGASGGRMKYLSAGLPIWDAAFIDMVVAVAGHLVDVEGGHFDHGSVSDMRRINENVVLIVSTGRCPVHHNGDLSVNGLLDSSRELASRILKERADAVGRIAAALAQEHSLSDGRLRDLACSMRSESATRSDGVNER